MVEAYGVPAERCSVIHPAPDPEFRPEAAEGERAALAERHGIRPAEDARRREGPAAYYFGREHLEQLLAECGLRLIDTTVPYPDRRAHYARSIVH